MFMKPKWNLEDLKAALEAGRSIGRDRLVADSWDVFGELGEVATVYYHIEGDGEKQNRARYDFTFDNTRSLDENFELLNESVGIFRKMAPRPESAAASY